MASRSITLRWRTTTRTLSGARTAERGCITLVARQVSQIWPAARCPRSTSFWEAQDSAVAGQRPADTPATDIRTGVKSGSAPTEKSSAWVPRYQARSTDRDLAQMDPRTAITQARSWTVG